MGEPFQQSGMSTPQLTVMVLVSCTHSCPCPQPDKHMPAAPLSGFTGVWVSLAHHAEKDRLGFHFLGSNKTDPLLNTLALPRRAIDEPHVILMAPFGSRLNPFEPTVHFDRPAPQLLLHLLPTSFPRESTRDLNSGFTFCFVWGLRRCSWIPPDSRNHVVLGTESGNPFEHMSWATSQAQQRFSVTRNLLANSTKVWTVVEITKIFAPSIL